MFCVNPGYLKAAPMITGAMETSCPVHTRLSQAWATTGGGGGLGGLTEESAGGGGGGGRKVAEGVERGFLPPPPAPLALPHLTPSKPPGGGTSSATLKFSRGPKWGQESCPVTER